MSKINNIVYPNTTFPDAVQELPIFTDLNVADQNNYIRYLQQILANNMTGANTYYELITDSAKINANKLNILSDTIGAIQAVYENTSSFTDIINEKQAEWQAEIDKFKVEPETLVYAHSGARLIFRTWYIKSSYRTNDIVYYNNKVWKSLKDNNIGVPPVENSLYWEHIYKKYTLVNVTRHHPALYMALTDVTTNLAYWDSDQWVKITLQGDKGDNGGSFNFREYWDNSTTYVEGDLVVYNEEAYVSLRNNNINHNPSTSDSWWRREFRTSPQYIPVQSETPTGQEEGDLWFQIV